MPSTKRKNETLLATLAVGRIDDDALYTKLILNAQLPIPTMDFALVKSANHTLGQPNDRILLIKRKGGYWPDVRWFFGGQQRKGETSHAALYRLVMRETGIELEFDEKQRRFKGVVYVPGVIDAYNPPNESEGKPAAHTMMHFHLLPVDEAFEPKLDATSADPQRYPINDLPEDLPEPVRDAIRNAWSRAVTVSGVPI